MTIRACCYLLLSCVLVPLFGAAQAIKPELIKTDDGATLVFNTVDSFFVVDVAGDKIEPAPTTDGFFQVDARLLRVVNTPKRTLSPTVGKQVLLSKEVLQMQFRRDLDEEQTVLQRPIRDTKQEYLTTAKGRLVLHWWFELPTGAQGGGSQRHYMSTICDQQVLTACAPVLPPDTQEALRQYLLNVMASVRESDDPINVREYAKELRGEK